jgi:integrase
MRVHDLRHAHATVMRRAGVDMKTISECLGHSSIAITADLYTHAVAGPDAYAADRVQDVIRTARGG